MDVVVCNSLEILKKKGLDKLVNGMGIIYHDSLIGSDVVIKVNLHSVNMTYV